LFPKLVVGGSNPSWSAINLTKKKLLEDMIVKEETEKIFKIKFASKAVAHILKKLKEETRAGITGRDLEKFACKLMEENNVKSSVLGYENFPAYICISLNEELTHGVPDDRVFKEGDLVSFDVACNYQGCHADAALTMIIGQGNEEKRKLLQVTENALIFAIKRIKPNITTTRSIGNNLEKYIRSHGFFPIKEYGGHGIGYSLHEKPFIPNYKHEKHLSKKIERGMFICIEPLVQFNDDKIKVSPINN